MEAGDNGLVQRFPIPSEAVCIVRTAEVVLHQLSARHPAGNGNIISVQHIIPKGRRYCSKAHLIEEDDLMEDVLTYIKMCRNALCEVIATYDLKDFEADITVIAPEMITQIRQIDQICRIFRTFMEKDFNEADFVIAATDDQKINQ